MPHDNKALAKASAEVVKWIARDTAGTVSEMRFVEGVGAAVGFGDHVMAGKATHAEVKAMALRLAHKFLEVADS